MQESRKAYRRRFIEQHNAAFPWGEVFVGKGIDIGPGDDPYPSASRVFDQKHGDANKLSTYFPNETFDWLHASQCLEHMHDPWKALEDWSKVVRPGGHMILTVPSWELYEGMRWPSVWNPDHKSTWSIWQRGSPAPKHVHVPDYCKWSKEHLGLETLRCVLVDTNYDYRVACTRDQTFDAVDNVECFIEMVFRKSA